MPSLGEVLTQLRERAGLTRVALAEKLGVARSLVTAREQGARQVPSGELERLVQALDEALVLTPGGWALAASPTPHAGDAEPEVLGRRTEAGSVRVLQGDRRVWAELQLTCLSHLDTVLQVSDDSLAPLCLSGDWVGVALGESVALGDVVLVQRGAQYLLRVFRGEDDHGFVRLHAVDPLGEHLYEPADRLEVLGPVCGLHRVGRLRAGSD